MSPLRFIPQHRKAEREGKNETKKQFFFTVNETPVTAAVRDTQTTLLKNHAITLLSHNSIGTDMYLIFNTQSTMTVISGWHSLWKCIVQELCESRGGHPGLSILTSLLVSVDVKLY